jgi:hypothetical protein
MNLSLLLLVPILILLITPLIMLVIRILQPDFAFFWLVATLGALSTWPVVLLLHSRIPESLTLVAWKPEQILPISPTLLLDPISWPFAMALASLVLAVILTDVARVTEVDWSAWASSLAITAIGMLAVLAGNPLTLIMAWGAIDLVELVILLSMALKSDDRERIVILFSTRIAGIVLLIAAGMAARSSGEILTFTNISPQTSIYLLLASGLRLGVVPIHQPFLGGMPLRRGLGTLLRMVPAAASLVLLARTATAGVSSSLSPYIFGFAALAAIYASISWISTTDELSGRPFWIMGGAALSVAAAVRVQPTASLAWGIATLLSGGLLFLLNIRHRFLRIFILLGLLGFTALPFTAAWEGVYLYAAPLNPFLVVFIIAQALLLIGYVRHATQIGPSLTGVERWVWLIYPWGLALLPVSHYIITYLGQPGTVEQNMSFPSLTASWPSLLTLGLVGGAIVWMSRGVNIHPRIVNTIRAGFSLNWFYRLLWRLYGLLGRLVTFVNLILEGEGGILWTLLILTLLFSLLAQSGLGG